MADVFDGIGGKSTDAWMRTLGDLQHAAWARPALATAGGKGKSSTWWPVRFAKELLDRETADCPALNQLFITSRPLRPWLSEWQELISERAWRKRDLQR